MIYTELIEKREPTTVPGYRYRSSRGLLTAFAITNGYSRSAQDATALLRVEQYLSLERVASIVRLNNSSKQLEL